MIALARDYSSEIPWSTPSTNRTYFEAYAIPAFASLRVQKSTHETPTLAEHLNSALHQAQTIVRNKSNSLGAEISSRAQSRLADLINDDNWDMDDPMPKRQSMETLFDAIAALTSTPFTSLSIAAGGALKATWIVEDRTITAVGRDDKSISWSKIEETSKSFKTEAGVSLIADFLANFRN